MQKYINKILVCAAVTLLVLCNINVNAALDGRWTLHPAASFRTDYKQSQVDRIIEGERYVYFVVRGSAFNRSTPYLVSSAFDIDPLQIFRYDKSKPFNSDNIKGLAQEAELSGFIPSAINYSPVHGVTAIVYDNRGIDFIFDNGEVIKSEVLNQSSFTSTLSAANSITFDSSAPVAYIAGDFGIVSIDMSNGELVNAYRLDKQIAWATRMGDNIVAFAGKFSPSSYSTDTYIFPVDSKIRKLGTPLAGLQNLQMLMPLSANVFAAMAPGSSDRQASLKLYEISSDGSVNSETIADGLAYDEAANDAYRHYFRTDGFAGPAKGGYWISSNDQYIILDGNAVTASASLLENAKNAVTKISKSSLTAGEKASKSAIYDGATAWLFTYDSNGLDASERGFYTREVANASTGSFSEKSTTFAPVAPVHMLCMFADWNENHGLLFRSISTQEEVGTNEKDCLFTLKNGMWRDLSYAANNSKYAPATVSAKFLNIDPVNSDWVWGMTNRGGIHRMDLSDYSNFFCIGSTYSSYNSWVNNYPVYLQLFDRDPLWSVMTFFSNCSFDADGTMWFFRFLINDYDSDEYRNYTDGHVPLFYLTAEERKAIAHGATKEDLAPMIQRGWDLKNLTSHHRGTIRALKHPANKNILMLTPNTWSEGSSRAVFIDHRGTLDDTSDDRRDYIYDIYDEEGNRMNWMEEHGTYEDMTTGDVWLFTTLGPLLFNPSDYLAGNRVCRRLKVDDPEGLSGGSDALELAVVKGVTPDNLGRKWIASKVGLFCLSPDCSTLLGYYTQANSPLPSDEVWGVVCNPEDGAIFAMTLGGIAEFNPSGSTPTVAPGEHLNIWPSQIRPDFKGYVNITGAIDGAVYEVKNANGAVVATLGMPEMGVIQWNCTATGGQRLSPGRYFIGRRGMEESHPVNILE